MGLLRSAGREPKGLFRNGGPADIFDEARAWLDGDYGTATRLSERDLRLLPERPADLRAMPPAPDPRLPDPPAEPSEEDRLLAAALLPAPPPTLIAGVETFRGRLPDPPPAETDGLSASGGEPGTAGQAGDGETGRYATHTAPWKVALTQRTWDGGANREAMISLWKGMGHLPANADDDPDGYAFADRQLRAAQANRASGVPVRWAPGDVAERAQPPAQRPGQSNPDYWRERLAGQGEIRAVDPADRTIPDRLRDLYAGIGIRNGKADRMARDASYLPMLGGLISLEQAGRDFDKGRYREGATNALLGGADFVGGGPALRAAGNSGEQMLRSALANAGRDGAAAVERGGPAVRRWPYADGEERLTVRGMDEADDPLAPPSIAAARGGRGRAPSVREQIGSWLRTMKPERHAASIAEVEAASRAFIGRPIRNNATGAQATVSKTTRGKMMSGSAVGRSVRGRDHLLAAANLDRLFERALPLRSSADLRGEPTIEGIHRFVAPMQTPDGGVAVTMLVKQTSHPGQPNPLYTVEAFDILPTAEIPLPALLGPVLRMFDERARRRQGRPKPGASAETAIPVRHPGQMRSLPSGGWVRRPYGSIARRDQGVDPRPRPWRATCSFDEGGEACPIIDRTRTEPVWVLTDRLQSQTYHQAEW